MDQSELTAVFRENHVGKIPPGLKTRFPQHSFPSTKVLGYFQETPYEASKGFLQNIKESQ